MCPILGVFIGSGLENKGNMSTSLLTPRVLTVAAIWTLVIYFAVLFQRPDPFWDRWAGVSVRRRVRIVTD